MHEQRQDLRPARLRLFQGRQTLLHGGVAVAGQRLAEQAALVAEGTVEAAAAEARRLLTRAAEERPEPLPRPEVTADFEHLRWFPFPDEVSRQPPRTASRDDRSYPGVLGS